jgi:hypothetical protein
MIDTTLLLSAVKSKYYAASDYRLAQLLDLTKTSVYKFVKKTDAPGEMTLTKISILLNVPAHVLYAAVKYERASDPSIKLVWLEAYKILGGDDVEKRLIKECFTDIEEKAEA